MEDWSSESGETVTITFDRERFATPLAEAEAAFALARRHDRGREVVEASLAASTRRERQLSQVRVPARFSYPRQRSTSKHSALIMRC